MEIKDFQVLTCLMPHQQEAVTWMIDKEKKGDVGGILADDMGLGKSLDCISLILSQPDQTTLCIVAKSILVQWMEEFKNHTNVPSQHLLIYHDRLKKNLQTDTRFLAVITTYETVRSEYTRFCAFQSKSNKKKTALFPLYQRTWYRIILDEAHKIRTSTNEITKAIMSLNSTKRWCVSGTPFQNKLQDVITLCKFIGTEPYCDTTWWSTNIKKEEAIKEWRKNFLMMRPKNILNSTTEAKEATIFVQFTPEEQEFYKTIFSDAIEAYLVFQSSQGHKKLRLFSTMLAWLIRLRQCCSHPLLLLGRMFTRQLAQQSCAPKELQVTERCMKCHHDQTLSNQPLQLLNCGHYMCEECLRLESSSASQCYTCEKASFWKITKIKTNGLLDIKESSKYRAVCTYCTKVIQEDPTAKFVIFSQWTSALDILEFCLRQRNIEYVRYDGDIHTIEERNKVIQNFTNFPQIKIQLTSLHAGGVGLNLVVADHVILFDLWYNPFLEDQAIDRIHRIGQKRCVHIVRVRVQNSIEEDIVKVQKKKRQAAQVVLAGIGLYMNTSSASNGITETDVHKIFKKASRVLHIKVKELDNLSSVPHSKRKISAFLTSKNLDKAGKPKKRKTRITVTTKTKVLKK